MKVLSNCVALNKQTTPAEFSAKAKMKELAKKINELEQFEKTTKKEMQDRMKFMNGSNAVRLDKMLTECEKEKELYREMLIDLQNGNY